MAKEICISSTPHETRLAILEDDQLAEIYYERENEYTLAGSIYNGRVTRVLPGMQSAFVDVGLERDAFLYVTDFVELEDPEETDEAELAAASPAPREVRPGSALDSSGSSEASSSEKPQRTEGRGDRNRRDRRPAPATVETVSSAPPQSPAPTPSAAPLVVSTTVSDAIAEEEANEGGGRRWRGRRRRRGGVRPAGEGSTSASPASSNPLPSSNASSVAVTPAALNSASENSSITVEATGEGHVEELVLRPSSRSGRDRSSRTHEPSLRGGESSRSGERSPRGSERSSRSETPSHGDAAPVPFVLPGESLSRYGGTAAQDEPKSSVTKPMPTSSSFKPASMVKDPIVWDGSGLMAGESISRLRKPETSSHSIEHPAADSDSRVSEVHEASNAGSPIAKDSEHTREASFKRDAMAAANLTDVNPEELEELDMEEIDFDEESTLNPEDETDESTEETTTAHDDRTTAPDDDHRALNGNKHRENSSSHAKDATATHNVDPTPPTGFRLFGFGKKKDEPARKPAVSASKYSPGKGHIEEELIDEEEFDSAPRHHSRGGDSDHDDLEEETLRAQIGSGALGEMVQEAHLDQHLHRSFGGNAEGFEEDDDSDDPTATAGTSAAGAGRSRNDRNDRTTRGRRGRTGSAPVAGAAGGQQRRGPSRRSAQTSDLPIISDLLKPGQEILVQIAKEPIAKKGARITSHIALPGRFLVFMPTVTHVGVSRKIDSDEERHRLKRILVSERGDATGGFIVRTAAEGASEEELRADLRFLLHLWDEIKTRSEGSKSPALIYHDLSLVERILRDQVSDNFSSIWVDSEADYERIVRFLNRFSPTLVRRVKLYTKEVPLFEHFGIQDEISKALRSKVWLKSGGSIVINQTEALVAIDINTGKFVGKTARLEDTILKTNLDAIPEIVRQVRLRDLGGIIVIDFIDMDERKNRNKVMAALEEALKVDRAPTKVLQFNDFGLVAITRKRVKQSLERTLSVPCPVCQATGMVKSPATVCNEIYIELRKMKKHFENADVLLRIHPETVKILKSNNASWLTDYEELIGKNILVKSDATLHPEQFDIQG